MWQLLRAASSAAVLATHLLVPARTGGEQLLGVFTERGLPAAAQIAFIGNREGGIGRLRGKRVAYLYLDGPPGRGELFGPARHGQKSSRPRPA